ncbi:hypothetical protein Dsin_019887 [Dipteronia sinensis]|uniref:Polyadenylate-binding protein n=1 Tax=Dipteronia sinensis TaxID=43782 RepID=A0AAE0E3H7_9ROSI|nr:hypothetical protein Dsin_019887 [Dipteronia sinensis]
MSSLNNLSDPMEANNTTTDQQPQLPLHSLYVGDLDPSVTENQLVDMFIKFGQLESTVLLQDIATQQSLCYGFVNFHRLEDAKRAMETLNYSVVNGKSIRIMWQQPNSEDRNSGKGNIFVKNLDTSIDNRKLNNLFSKFGYILSCKVAVEENGKSKGYGFVQFENEEPANTAIENLNGSILEGKSLYVAHFIKKYDRTQASFTNVYVKNLEPDVTEGRLEEKFSKFGNITSLHISKDSNGVSRGFGFVNFENPEDAKRAVETMHGTQSGSKVLYVARAQKLAERKQVLRMRHERIQMIKGRNVYVKNINDDVNEDILKAHFSPFGFITSVRIMRTLKGISKGFGFVLFSQAENALRAINAVNGIMFHGKPLYVALAQSKAERREFLQILYANYRAGFPGISTYTLPNFYHRAPAPAPFNYQPIDYSRLGWRQPPAFQPPMIAAADSTNHRGRMMNGLPFMPIATHHRPGLNNNQNMHTYNYPNHYHQSAGRVNNIANGHPRASGVDSEKNLSSMLTAATPEERKVILRNHLYPLVKKLESNLCSNIIDLLLEMDNSELLVLLDSPESLAAKVDEALLVLQDTLEDTTKAVNGSI